LAFAADTVVREYLEAHPQHTAAMIRLCQAAQQQWFEDWERLQKIVEGARKRVDDVVTLP
jgi:hypothetical protein